MRISRSIVTGGAGFIGSNLVDHLVKIGHKVIVIDNFVSGKKAKLSHHKKSDVKVIKLDLSNSKKIDKYFKKIDYVFHLAGLAEIIPSMKNPKKYFNTNVIVRLMLLRQQKKLR